MRMFYLRFALDAIRKNRKTYLPFILTTVLMVSMYHIIVTLSGSRALDGTFGDTSLMQLLFLGSWIIFIFSVIFLFYTSSFIMTSRRQEFGLYSVLGMGKGHITIILFFETMIAALCGIILGLIVGSVLNWAAFLILVNMLGGDPFTPFSLSFETILLTAELYLGIFLLIFLWNALRLRFSSTVSLLRSSKEGEKEPKAKWLTAILGVLLLASGYSLAIIIKNPVGAFTLFFVAVILVILGTYCLFTAGSIVFLKLLKKNKGYYYKTNHFISVSGMLYRMKQNAVSLGNICILSTMVLVTISSTMCLYVGCDDMIEAQYPKTLNLEIWSSDNTPKTTQFAIDQLTELIELQGAKPENEISLTYLSIGATQRGNHFITDTSQGTVMDQLTNLVNFTALPLSDYNRYANTPASLNEGEILVYGSNGYSYDTALILGKTYTVKEKLKSIPHETILVDGYISTVVAVVPDQELYVLYDLQREEYGQYASNLYTYCGMDVADRDAAAAVSAVYEDTVYDFLTNGGVEEEYGFWNVNLFNRNTEEAGVYQLYGGLFFVGIFLGLLFLMATILIIYYKQLSEGLSDRKRFSIMQKVGLTKREIRKSIHSQVLTMFFLPLATSFVHTAFAFPMLRRCLQLMGMNSTAEFVWSLMTCCGVFAVVYFIVYMVTSRVYYNIVNE